MLSVTRRPEWDHAFVELTECIVCAAPIRLRNGYAVRHVDAVAFIGCLGCLASFQGNAERRLDHPCPDCEVGESLDSPMTEWTCY
jgi:hypothetical protein